MKIKLFVFTIFLTIAIFCSGGIIKAVDNSALIAQLQAQIAQIMAQIQALLAQQGTTPTNWCHTFNTNLGFAQSGTDDVSALHIVLQKEGITYGSDSSTTYSEDTATAVTHFQVKYGISQTGYVGSTTRAKLNALYGCSATPPPTVCVPNWQTGSWSTCSNNQQVRTVSDSNSCGVTTNEPTTSQSCTVACTPNWQCNNWSSCSNSQRTRYCYDSNNCGMAINEPATTQSCTVACTPNWQCSWGPCANGHQVQVATDSNNCGVTTGRDVACSSLGRECSQQLNSQAVNGACGLPANIGFGPISATIANNLLCSAGTASSVSGNNPWTWTCYGNNGGTDAVCNAIARAVNGVCGSANGVATTTAPTSGLCVAAGDSPVSGNGPWTWTCLGAYGGTDASCSAPLNNNGVNIPTSIGPITVTYPNGGEQWTIGQKYNIKWKVDSSSASNMVNIYLSKSTCVVPAGIDGTWCSYGIAYGVPNTGSYQWDTNNRMFGDAGPNSVSVSPRSDYQINICLSGTNNCDRSDRNFSFVQP